MYIHNMSVYTYNHKFPKLNDLNSLSILTFELYVIILQKFSLDSWPSISPSFRKYSHTCTNHRNGTAKKMVWGGGNYQVAKNIRVIFSVKSLCIFHHEKIQKPSHLPTARFLVSCRPCGWRCVLKERA